MSTLQYHCHYKLHQRITPETQRTVLNGFIVVTGINTAIYLLGHTTRLYAFQHHILGALSKGRREPRLAGGKEKENGSEKKRKEKGVKKKKDLSINPSQEVIGGPPRDHRFSRPGTGVEL